MSRRTTIETFRRRHRRAAMRIDALVHPKPWSRGLWQRELDRTDRRYLVARRNARVIGYAGALLALDDAHITTIATHPDHQRRGVGSDLLAALMAEALEAGATRMTLEVRASNTAAQRLYECFGFVVAGRRTGYYQPDGEDALVMWAHDISSSVRASSARHRRPIEVHQ